MAQPQAAARAVTLDVVVEPIGLEIHADPTRTLQILINLLTNAIKRTPSGGRVMVSATTAANMAAVDVSDGGGTLTPQEADQLFETFGRAGSSLLTRPDQGLGLDLPIARGLARLMGGDLTLLATGPAGSTFRLTLPRARLMVAKP